MPSANTAIVPEQTKPTTVFRIGGRTTPPSPPVTVWLTYRCMNPECWEFQGTWSIQCVMQDRKVKPSDDDSWTCEHCGKIGVPVG